MFGFDYSQTIDSFRGLPIYLREYKLFKQLMKNDHVFPMGKLYPCLEDRFDNSGSAHGHYFHQDLLVARRIFEKNPKRHVDVGSRVDGFVAHVAAFRDIDVLDIRPLQNKTHNISFKQADFMSELPTDLNESTDSLSCLHALEHFGLGRYGDPVSPDGYLTGLENLYSVLKPGGYLYFSVPIGPQRTEFNAQRVFSVEYLMKLFEGRYELKSFSYINDAGDLFENADLNPENIQNNFACHYGCGVLELQKV